MIGMLVQDPSKVNDVKLHDMSLLWLQTYRNCQTCIGGNALRCTMCRGTGKVLYQVKNYTLRSGEKATAEAIADAIAENRAKLVHLPATMDLNVPLPSKDCDSCDGSGVIKCPECKDKLQVRISADDVITTYQLLSSLLYKFFKVLSDPAQRMVYDEIHGYALTAINPFFDDSSPKDHVFVDEFSCIGCKNCANVCGQKLNDHVLLVRT
uniref:4Fe-4S ferredoxin-type domain-containing protein n=1 Tax=Lactuca sativa TaxID=4236 RepID=A0A9R1X5H7_LACSA|nr:hypothetical protein LSAT_V11C700376660 [Lactuca sativa]